TAVSTRRSTRESPAAISSAARWRSSMRPWSETAKSTRSCLPPPSRTSCAPRTARSFHHASTATSSASPATAHAAIAIHSAVETHALPEREDDPELSRVVRRRHLAGHRLDVDLDRRRQPEEAVDVDVREGDRRRLAGIDDRDLLAYDDRLR